MQPADCRLHVFEGASEATRVWIKGRGFSVRTLLGSLAGAMQLEGCSLVISRRVPGPAAEVLLHWHAAVGMLQRSREALHRGLQRLFPACACSHACPITHPSQAILHASLKLLLLPLRPQASAAGLPPLPRACEWGSAERGACRRRAVQREGALAHSAPSNRAAWPLHLVTLLHATSALCFAAVV